MVLRKVMNSITCILGIIGIGYGRLWGLAGSMYPCFGSQGIFCEFLSL